MRIVYIGTLWRYDDGYWHKSEIKEFARKTKTSHGTLFVPLKKARRFSCLALLLTFWFLYQHKKSCIFSIPGRYRKWVSSFYIKEDSRWMAWLSRPWFQKAFFRQLRRGHYTRPFCDPKLALKIDPNEPSKRKINQKLSPKYSSK